MWKSKRFIVIAVIVGVIAVGGVAGVAIAKTAGTAGSNTSTAVALATSDNTSQGLIGRVATILGLPQSTVQNAFDQAQKDMANQALQNRLSGLVQQGKITQDQANQYQNWYESRPDVPLPGMGPMGQLGRRGFGFGMKPGTAPPATTTTP